MVGYYEDIMPTVSDSVPGSMFSDKTAFAISETACDEFKLAVSRRLLIGYVAYGFKNDAGCVTEVASRFMLHYIWSPFDFQNLFTPDLADMSP
jgi:hypothetical protein